MSLTELELVADDATLRKATVDSEVYEWFGRLGAKGVQATARAARKWGEGNGGKKDERARRQAMRQTTDARQKVR